MFLNAAPIDTSPREMWCHPRGRHSNPHETYQLRSFFHYFALSLSLHKVRPKPIKGEQRQQQHQPKRYVIASCPLTSHVAPAAFSSSNEQSSLQSHKGCMLRCFMSVGPSAPTYALHALYNRNNRPTVCVLCIQLNSACQLFF
jgi:hypothetical protein